MQLNLMLVGVRIVRLFNGSHEQTQLNRVCCFLNWGFSLFLKDQFFQIILAKFMLVTNNFLMDISIPFKVYSSVNYC